ncbi:MAG: hypothetical protein ACRDTJ_21065 [Pseudonocardiaceae bacterium]
MDGMSEAQHDHSGEHMVWCRNCETEHVASIPPITYVCRDCGWGQQDYAMGRSHLLYNPGHAITDVRHPVSELEHNKDRCCTTCNTHVNPHRGCMLR